MSWEQEKPRKMERWTKKNPQLDIVMSKNIFLILIFFKWANVTKRILEFVKEFTPGQIGVFSKNDSRKPPLPAINPLKVCNTHQRPIHKSH